MNTPKIFADFQNADVHGRLRLTCHGTREDLARQQIHLREGLQLTLYDADADERGQACELQAQGVVAFSKEEQCWVAAIDWNDLRQVASKTPENGQRMHSAN